MTKQPPIPWHRLNQLLKEEQDEAVVKKMLDYETATLRRWLWLRRLYHKYSALRRRRELAELKRRALRRPS